MRGCLTDKGYICVLCSNFNKAESSSRGTLIVWSGSSGCKDWRRAGLYACHI